MLELSEHLRAHLPRGREFEHVMALEGEVFRHHKNRRTIRAQIGGRSYFVKVHGPTGWREILKNGLRGRWPVLTARPEWAAIKRLEALGVPTVHAAGYGCRGRLPHRRESFIITEALEGMIHLSEVPPTVSRSRLRGLLVQTARIARTLHANGLNHRDFYLCHFMVRDRDWSAREPKDALQLHLIDLHRMQIRPGRAAPRRWAIKDISGLLFSALDAGLTGRDAVRFLREYWGPHWRDRWVSHAGWRRAVLRRAVNLYRSEHGRSPRLPDGLANSP